MNCLIEKSGKVIECDRYGQDHGIACKQATGHTLLQFITKDSGVRVKPCWPNDDTIAIEYCTKPNDKQMSIIDNILRANDYYVVVLNFKTIEKYRPIRHFEP